MPASLMGAGISVPGPKLGADRTIAFRPPTARKLAAGPSADIAFRPPTARKLAAGPSADMLSA